MRDLGLPEVDVGEAVAEVLARLLLCLDGPGVGVVAEADVLVAESLGGAAGHVRGSVVAVVALEPVVGCVLGEEGSAGRGHEGRDFHHGVIPV